MLVLNGIFLSEGEASQVRNFLHVLFVYGHVPPDI